MWHIGKLGLPAPLLSAVSLMYLSVQLFFAISAFALFHSALRSPSSTGAYFAKRFFRIAPLFYLLVAWNYERTGWLGWDTLAANLTFTFNLVPGLEGSAVWTGWSVGVEMLFYLLLPVLLAGVRGWRGFALLLVAACALQMIWWRYAQPALGMLYTYISILGNLVPFAAGLLAYSTYRDHGERLRGRRAAAALAAATLGLLLACAADPLQLQLRAPGLYFALWGIAFGVSCLWQAVHPSPLLSARWLQYLADRSFSIYLLQAIVIHLSLPLYADMLASGIPEGLPLYVAGLVVSLAMVLALAELTYRFVEMPGIRIGHRTAAWLDRARRRTSRVAIPDEVELGVVK